MIWDFILALLCGSMAAHRERTAKKAALLAADNLMSRFCEKGQFFRHGDSLARRTIIV